MEWELKGVVPVIFGKNVQNKRGLTPFLTPFHLLLPVTIYRMDTIFLGNSLSRWLQALLTFMGTLIILLVVRAVFRKIAQRTPKPNFVITLISQLILPAILIVAAWISSHFLEISAPVSSLLRILLIALLAIQAGRWADLAVEHWNTLQNAKLLDDDLARRTSLRGIAIIARILIWLVVVLVVLQSIPNFDIAGIIASLGLGGIAIGLAAQSLVADLLSSLTIHLDKPFGPGDFIKTGNFSGTVEQIGLKTTRLRNLSGEELSISNSELLKAPLQNFSRLEERRVSLTLQIAYNTPAEKLAVIPRLIEDAFQDLENVRFSRAHFQTYAPAGLVYEIVYFVTSPDYDVLVKAQNLVNLRIYQNLQNEAIYFSTIPVIPLEVASRA